MTDSAPAAEPAGGPASAPPAGPDDGTTPGAGPRIGSDLAIIAIAATLFLLPAIFATELTTVDEARYTQVAREMRLDDRWLAPRLNGIEYWQKPALFFDLLQIPQRATGRVSAAGSRFVVLPFAIAVLFLTYGCGYLLAGRRSARLAAAMLATSGLFFEFAAAAVLDVPMLAFITGAFFSYLVWTRTERRKVPWQIGAALCMGIGCHFKGPVAILLPGAVMAIDSISRHRWRAFRSPAGYWIPVAALLTLGAWFVPMAMVYGDTFVDYMIEKHIVKRSVSAEAPHGRPFYYYGPIILASWMPWILLAPAAWIATVRRGLGAHSDPRSENPLRFPFIWAWSIPLVLSLIASKRTQYLLPALPGFALWIAIALDGWLREGDIPGRVGRGTVAVLRVFVIFCAACGVTLAIVGIVGRSSPASLPIPTSAPGELTSALTGGWAIGVGLGIAVFLCFAAGLLRRPTPARVFLALLIVGIGGNEIRGWSVASLRDRFIRANEFGAELRTMLDAGTEIGIYAMRLNGTYLLHSGATSFEALSDEEEVPDLDEITEFLDRGGPRAVIGKRRYLERYIWPAFEERPIVVLAAHREGRSQVVLFGNSAAIAQWQLLHPDTTPTLIELDRSDGEG